MLAVYNIERMKVNNHGKDVTVDFYLFSVIKVKYRARGVSCV